MQVLILNCFDNDSELGVKSYAVFRKLVVSTFTSLNGSLKLSEKRTTNKTNSNIRRTNYENINYQSSFSSDSDSEDKHILGPKDATKFNRIQYDGELNSDEDIGDIENDNNFIERRMDEINDLVLDWEFDIINNESKKFIKDFDKIDFIFIGGDMKKVKG